MKKYLLIKRRKIKIAKNSIDFVNWMRKCDFQRWETNQDFMEAYSYRKYTFERIKLRSDNEDVFIKDLQLYDILKIECEKPIVSLIKNLFPNSKKTSPQVK